MTAAVAALAGRIAVAQQVLDVPGPVPDLDGDGLFDALQTIIESFGPHPDPEAVWLLIIALTAAYPDRALVRSVTRALAIKESEDAATWVLHELAPLALGSGHALASLRVVSDRPLIDVNHTAKSMFLTGIQRVVRGVAAQWQAEHVVELVAWSARGGGYRPLTTAERTRLLEGEVGAFDLDAEEAATIAQGRDEPETLVLVVPWGVPVVLIEVPPEEMSDRLAALAALTTSSVRLVGHDCIPISSAEMLSLVEAEKFGHYLELVKHADRLAGVSRSAAAEFEGFVSTLPTQGLVGPRVSTCPLPHTATVPGLPQEAPAAEPGEDVSAPLVICVGTIGRRKNQTALVEAAEILWREGLSFRVRLIGHVAAEHTPLVGLISELQNLGRPLTVEAGVSDQRIADSLADARCLVFPSLHEGFGLPVSEALSQGVPVITSDFGSTRELAEGQGGLLVDPEDPVALAAAIRQLLTDDGVHARLVAEALARPTRTWMEYGHDLWQELLA